MGEPGAAEQFGLPQSSIGADPDATTTVARSVGADISFFLFLAFSIFWYFFKILMNLFPGISGDFWGFPGISGGGLLKPI